MLHDIFEDNKTYIACKHDYSDLEEKIDFVMSNYDEVQEKIVLNMRKKIESHMHPNNIALHLYDVFKELKGVMV